MAIELMPLDEISPDAPGDIYVGATPAMPAPDGADRAHLFSDYRPFAALKAVCMIGQMWPNDLTADGVFWIDSQPDVCFKIRISEGIAAYRPAGYWMARHMNADALPTPIAQAITGRGGHPVYGDRIQHIQFANAGEDWDRIESMLRRCLTDDPASAPRAAQPDP
jgi:hypothetical protein